jgi:multidrug efflux pump
MAGVDRYQTNASLVFVDLKPKSERSQSADDIIVRLRDKLSQVPGAQLFLQSVQDIRAGGRPSNAQYQYTFQGESADLYHQ